MPREDYIGDWDDHNSGDPVNITNRSGLSSIRYRVGKYHDIKARMLRCLSLEPKLSSLNTPEPSFNLALVLIDSWSVIADILMFYQERMTNEAYIRTANEMSSVMNLSDMVGYKAKPGLAASTYLQFTLETSSGVDSSVIPLGTQVQSIPARGESPQVFETSELIEARPEWNDLRPLMITPQSLDLTKNIVDVSLHDSNLELNMGDKLLIIHVSGRYLLTVQNKEINQSANLVKIKAKRVIEPPPLMIFQIPDTDVFWRIGSDIQVDDGYYTEGDGGIEVDSRNRYIKPVDDNNTTTAERLRSMNTLSEYRAFAWEHSVTMGNVFQYVNAAEWSIPDTEVYLFRNENKAKVFGHNAQDFRSLPWHLKEQYQIDWDNNTIPINKNSSGNLHNTFGLTIYLDNVYEGITSDSWAVLLTSNNHRHECKITDTFEETVSDFNISSRVTALVLDSTREDLEEFGHRNTTVYLQTEKVELSPVILEAPVSGSQIDLSIGTELKPGQYLSITGEPIDIVSKVLVSEIATVSHIRIIDGRTRIFLKNNLKHVYKRDTVFINGNVAGATHGETVREVLGNGDSSQTFQEFMLSNNPLTFVSSPSKQGFESTLEILVGNIKWKENTDLLFLKPNDQVYVLGRGKDGNVSVLFGDGEHGSRLPSGLENVTATYRKNGIGKAGLLRKGQLSLLKTRPFGVKNVTNPVDTINGSDPEDQRDIKKNYIFPIFTMDRIVSLTDFEYFANAFNGVGKAQAISVWDKDKKIVHITVATVNGDKINTNSQLYINLLKAIEKVKDPTILFKIDSAKIRKFNVEVRIMVSDNYKLEAVRKNVQLELIGSFSFDQRNFGQDVTIDEITQVIQRVEGICGSLVSVLYEFGRKRESNVTLQCRSAYWDTNKRIVLPGELFIINDAPEGIIINDMM